MNICLMLEVHRDYATVYPSLFVFTLEDQNGYGFGVSLFIWTFSFIFHNENAIF